MTVPPSLRRAGRILGWSLLGLVLVLFFALAGGMAFLRTQPGERWIADTAVSVLKNVGIEAQIGSLEGPLPFSLHLREVRLADGAFGWTCPKPRCASVPVRCCEGICWWRN